MTFSTTIMLDPTCSCDCGGCGCVGVDRATLLGTGYGPWTTSHAGGTIYNVPFPPSIPGGCPGQQIAWFNPTTPRSVWISSDPCPEDYSANYSLDFTVTNASVAKLCGIFMADDAAKISVNGTDVTTHYGAYFGWSGFDIRQADFPGLFVNGTNTITFHQIDTGAAVSGLRVEFCVTKPKRWWCGSCINNVFFTQDGWTVFYSEMADGGGPPPYPGGCPGAFIESVTGPYTTEAEAETYCPGTWCYECESADPEATNPVYVCSGTDGDCEDVMAWYYPEPTEEVPEPEPIPPTTTSKTRVVDCDDCPGGMGMMKTATATNTVTAAGKMKPGPIIRQSGRKNKNCGCRKTGPTL